jgi:hypothetical protein
MPNKIVTQGFGTGTTYGIPTTIALDSTSTLSITSSLVGQYQATGVVTGVQLRSVSTANGVTGSYSILNGAPGTVFLDGVSNFLVNTTTSVGIVFIGAG